jgi:hypothetical protein
MKWYEGETMRRRHLFFASDSELYSYERSEVETSYDFIPLRFRRGMKSFEGETMRRRHLFFAATASCILHMTVRLYERTEVKISYDFCMTSLGGI